MAELRMGILYLNGPMLLRNGLKKTDVALLTESEAENEASSNMR